jgi:hypothetical protein
MSFLKKIFRTQNNPITFSYRENKTFSVKKSMRGYFYRCLSSIPVEKRFREKYEICEFGSTVAVPYLNF